MTLHESLKVPVIATRPMMGFAEVSLLLEVDSDESTNKTL